MPHADHLLQAPPETNVAAQDAGGAWSVLFTGHAAPLKHPWRRRVLFLAFCVARGLVRWLPMAVAQVLGRGLGYAACLVLRRHRAVAWANVRHALGPAASRRTCRDVVWGTFVNLGKTALEWFVLERYTPQQIQRAVEVRGLSHLRQALVQGRGVIAVSAHFGNWELLPMALAGLGFRGGVLARRLRYPEYEQFLMGMRRRKGVATLRRGSVAEAVRVLKANQILGVVPDQDVDSLDGVFVDFFSQPAYTPSGPAALALMTGAAILPCLVVRSGRRFRVMLEAPLVISRTDDRARDLTAVTQQWSRVVESYVRAHPDQWAWVHPRWKTQPSADIRHQTSDIRPNTPRRPHPIPQALVSFFLLTAYCLLPTALQGCAKSPTPPSAAAPSATVPLRSAVPPPALNQQLDTFTMAGYAADGVKRWDMNGRGALLEGAFMTVKAPSAITYGLSDDLDPATAMPRSAKLTASLAQVEQATRRVRMEHDVAIQTSDGLWLFSPLMWWIPDASELTTDQPVRIETDHMLLRGYGATGHTQLKRAVIERDVEMVLNPSNEDVPGGNSHVQISCDGPLEFDYERNIAVFEDNVHIKDSQGDVYSDRLIAHLDRATRTVRYAEAIGHVRIIQPGNVATGERAIYEPVMGKVTLLGGPSLLIEDSEQGLNTPVAVPAPPASVPLPGSPVVVEPLPEGPGTKTEAMAHTLGQLEATPSVVAEGPAALDTSSSAGRVPARSDEGAAN